MCGFSFGPYLIIRWLQFASEISLFGFLSIKSLGNLAYYYYQDLILRIVEDVGITIFILISLFLLKKRNVFLIFILFKDMGPF